MQGRRERWKYGSLFVLLKDSYVEAGRAGRHHAKRKDRAILYPTCLLAYATFEVQLHVHVTPQT